MAAGRADRRLRPAVHPRVPAPRADGVARPAGRSGRPGRGPAPRCWRTTRSRSALARAAHDARARLRMAGARPGACRRVRGDRDEPVAAARRLDPGGGAAPHPAPGHARGSAARTRSSTSPTCARGLRPRPGVRERVPPLPRARSDGAGRLQGHVPRSPRAADRPAHQLRAPGHRALLVPFYLLAHGGVLVARALGAPVAADGFSRPTSPPPATRPGLYGMVGLLLLHGALVRFGGFPEPAAAWATAAVLWGTPAPLLHDARLPASPTPSRCSWSRSSSG